MPTWLSAEITRLFDDHLDAGWRDRHDDPGIWARVLEISENTGDADLAKARNVKALTNHEYGYRLRVGNYRVFFDHDGAVRIVSIEEVRKRDERTY